MKDILFIIPQLAKGGSEQLVLDLAKTLKSRGHSCSVLYFAFDDDNVFKSSFEKEKINLYFVTKNRTIDLQTINKINTIFKDKGELIVNAHHFVSLFYAFLCFGFKRKVKIFYTEHSEWEIDHIRIWWKTIGIFILKKIEGCISINPQLTIALEKCFLVKESKLHTIVNGVNLNVFNRKNRKTKNHYKAELGISEHTKVIGIVANMRKNKNHDFLLQAFNMLREKIDVKLIIIGEGFVNDSENSELAIKQYIENNNLKKDTLLLGKRNDIAELLSVMDIFCLVSIKEGLPLSILEAMSSSLPIVGTNVEGIKDIIKHEVNGYLVELSDVEDLSSKLFTLLSNDDLRIRMGDESRKMAKKLYSLETCVDNYESLFCKAE